MLSCRVSAGGARSQGKGVRTLLSFVKFEHTLFALPFAYTGMLLAERGWPGLTVFFWITIAMIGARTASMALNRVVDAELDARNPRTADREIPRGALTRRDGLLLALVGFALFIWAGWALNPLTLALLPVAVLFLSVYPYLKRFTWLCHLWLGVTIGAAAAGGWIAVTGEFAPGATLLWLAVALWIQGFDIIYALLDSDFDRRHRLKSVPARFGADVARRLAMLSHLAAWIAFVLAGAATGSGWVYAAGVVAVGAVLVFEHYLVASRGAAAALTSFNVNLYVGAIMLVATALDVALVT